MTLDDPAAASSGEPRLAFSPGETAVLLGISPELVHDLLRTGRLRSVKAGRRRLISRVHIEAFLAGDAARPVDTGRRSMLPWHTSVRLAGPAGHPGRESAGHQHGCSEASTDPRPIAD